MLYFEIDKSCSSLGLLERRGKGKYDFVSEKNDLMGDHLYYLYFKEKPDRGVSPSPSQREDEETKKVRVLTRLIPFTVQESLW